MEIEVSEADLWPAFATGLPYATVGWRRDLAGAAWAVIVMSASTSPARRWHTVPPDSLRRGGSGMNAYGRLEGNKGSDYGSVMATILSARSEPSRSARSHGRATEVEGPRSDLYGGS
jgi:hypothetical protein